MNDEYRKPILTVDVVMLVLEEGALKVALAPRAAEPYAGHLALPGGYVHVDADQSTQDTAKRVLRQKLGFEPAHLEQVFTHSSPSRDPRGWSASVVYLALHQVSDLKELVADQKLSLWDISQLPPRVGFDHAFLIEQAVQRLRNKSYYTQLVAHLLPKEFTLLQLREAFEVIGRQRLNPANFRRKVLDTWSLKETRIVQGTGRPAQAYTLA